MWRGTSTNWNYWESCSLLCKNPSLPKNHAHPQPGRTDQRSPLCRTISTCRNRSFTVPRTDKGRRNKRRMARRSHYRRRQDQTRRTRITTTFPVRFITSPVTSTSEIENETKEKHHCPSRRHSKTIISCSFTRPIAFKVETCTPSSWR